MIEKNAWQSLPTERKYTNECEPSKIFVWPLLRYTVDILLSNITTSVSALSLGIEVSDVT